MRDETRKISQQLISDLKPGDLRVRSWLIGLVDGIHFQGGKLRAHKRPLVKPESSPVSVRFVLVLEPGSCALKHRVCRVSPSMVRAEPFVRNQSAPRRRHSSLISTSVKVVNMTITQRGMAD